MTQQPEQNNNTILPPDIRLDYTNQLSETDAMIQSFDKYYQSIKQNAFGRILMKSLGIVIEFFFYALFVLAFTGWIFSLTLSLPAFTQDLGSGVTTTTTVQIEAVDTLFFVLRLTVFLVAMMFLSVGLLFRYIRKKNNAIYKCGELLDESLRKLRSRGEKIKFILHALS
ncbi:MAG: hypothetical protein HY960_11005 [Ignavibacteriae bacterium]|nr:hypothetical protein [Ignavibacteriota bacterium]